MPVPGCRCSSEAALALRLRRDELGSTHGGQRSAILFAMWPTKRMHPTQTSNAIWNRACGELPDIARPGDRALRAALDFHGFVMNGGLDHALDVAGHDAEHAAAGWDHLGCRRGATIIRRALAAVPDMPSDPSARQEYFIDGLSDAQAETLEAMGEHYDELDADGVFEQAFLKHLRKKPDDFAPL